MKYIIDTNIWIYYFSSTSPFHAKSRKFINELDFKVADYYISTQILIEIYVILTSTRIPEPQLPTDVLDKLNRLVKTPIIVVGHSVRSMIYLEKLLAKYKPIGQKVWDFQIVASMLDNHIDYIYTNNVKDFSNVQEIKTINPLNDDL